MRYKVHLLLVLESGEEQLRSFYVEGSRVSEAIEKAEEQASAIEDVQDVYIQEVERA